MILTELGASDSGEAETMELQLLRLCPSKRIPRLPTFSLVNKDAMAVCIVPGTEIRELDTLTRIANQLSASSS